MTGETAKRIMDVAHQLLVERGFSAFSYADIADAIHIRKASIHHHFPTKTALVVAVLDRHRQRMLEAHAALDKHVSSPVDRLKKFVGHWEACIQSMTEPFCIAALLGAELPGLPEEVQAEVEKHFIHLRQWIARTLKAGLKQKTIRLQKTARRGSGDAHGRSPWRDDLRPREPFPPDLSAGHRQRHTTTATRVI